MKHISFDHLHNFTLGFDTLFRELEKSYQTPSNNFPPHNIIKVDDNKYIVEFAVAGYSKDDINVTVEDNLLTIKGEQKSSPDTAVYYVHRGISSKKFTKTLRVLDTVKVRGASLVNGMLQISLENEIPEQKKPIQININDNQEPNTYNPQLLTE